MKAILSLLFIAAVAVLVGWFLLSRKDPTSPSSAIDSLALSRERQQARINDLESGRRTDRLRFDSLKQVYNAKLTVVLDSVSRIRKNPKVEKVIKEVPEVAHAFNQYERLSLLQAARIAELETLAREDSLSDLRYTQARDSLDDNFKSEILRCQDQTIALEKRLKRAENSLTLGLSAGPALLVSPDGKVYGGLGISVGLTLRLRIKKSSRS